MSSASPTAVVATMVRLAAVPAVAVAVVAIVSMVAVSQNAKTIPFVVPFVVSFVVSCSARLLLHVGLVRSQCQRCQSLGMLLHTSQSIRAVPVPAVVAALRSPCLPGVRRFRRCAVAGLLPWHTFEVRTPSPAHLPAWSNVAQQQRASAAETRAVQRSMVAVPPPPLPVESSLSSVAVPVEFSVFLTHICC